MFYLCYDPLCHHLLKYSYLGMAGLIDTSKTTWTSVSVRVQGKKMKEKAKEKKKTRISLPNRKSCVDTTKGDVAD